MSLALALAACDDADGAGGSDAAVSSALTYYGDAKAIVDTKCATCHRPADIDPLPL